MNPSTEISKSESDLAHSAEKPALYPHSSMYYSYINTLSPQDERALKTLARSISLCQNRFSLIFVRCDRSYPKSFALSLLHERYNLDPEVLKVPITARHLYPLVETSQIADENRQYESGQRESRQRESRQRESGQASSLFIVGLDTVTHLDELLVSINQARNEFQRHFAFPVVIWVNDDSIKKLIKLAPDFYNWASAPIALGYLDNDALVTKVS